MLIKKIILPLVAGLVLLSCVTTRKTSRQDPGKDAAVAKAATARKDTVNKIKPYKEVITAKAITQNGFFKVHMVNDRWYFEIPDSIFDRDLLLVNRISKGNFNGPFTSYAGDDLANEMIRLSRRPGKVFIKQMNYVLRADGKEGQMQASVDNSNMQALIVAFDIKALSPDSSGVVIDVTDLFNSDNEFFFIPGFKKTTLGYALSSYQADKSYIESIHSFAGNVEIKSIKTYVKGASPAVVPPGNVTFEISNSIVLLPRTAMKPRYNDTRVGYFVKGYYNYNAARPVEPEWVITRWRLEPKTEDLAKYKRGELVEPQKPIVFYIDPATPKKWVPYLIEGVNSWQKAFEKAGFKNAIYALEAPVNDSTWSLEDAAHNMIIYKASSTQNAMGPNISDPRSGEILESHVQWFHNVQQLLHDWYFVQAAPNDPAARTMQFDDALMGKLIRYVCAHEIGHTLGLQHNFGASSTVPVDSLRSKRYVRSNGFCPSIMDYARFNYVAQPSDSMEQDDLMSRIGVYDEWAIEWGYKWLNDWETKEQEKTYLKKWVTSRLEKDQRLLFGAQTSTSINRDPAREAEDLGDDAVKAGRYGIANLKRIMLNLKEWAKIPNENYEPLRHMNSEVFQQYVSYLDHAILNLGGEIRQEKMVEEKQAGLRFPSREIQKATVQFLQDELFTRPAWLMNNEIYLLTATEGTAGEKGYLASFQALNKEVLNKIFSHQTLFFLRSAQAAQPAGTYKVDEFLDDLERDTWKELKTAAPIDMYRRNLQKLYVDRLISLLDIKQARGATDSYILLNINSDVFPLLKKQLKDLLTRIGAAIPVYKDLTTKYHLIELRDRIRDALYGKNSYSEGLAAGTESKNAIRSFGMDRTTQPSYDPSSSQQQTGCWENVMDRNCWGAEENN